MKTTTKIWKRLFLVACMIVMTFSLTTFATEGDLGGDSDNQTEFAGYDVRFVDEKGDVLGDTTTCYFKGTEVTPEIVIGDVTTDEAGNETITEKLVKDTDYEVSYEDNGNVGIAKAVITGKNTYEGQTAEAEFNVKADFKDAVLKLSKKEYIYTSAAKKPKITVTVGDVVIPAENYIVSYENNKQIGTGKAVITGTKYCEGVLTDEFKIVLEAPEMESISSSYSSISLKWTECYGAAGYQVYRSEAPDSGFKRIYTATSGTKLSLKNSSGLKFNGTYYYKVRSYRTVNGEKVYSAYSDVAEETLRTAVPTISSAKAETATSITVNWKKVSSASGYAIYRSTEEEGEYTRIGRISGSSKQSYEDKSAECGVVYYYKVASYKSVDGEKYESDLSKDCVSAQTQPGKVQLDNCSYKAEKVTLKWKKASGAQMYQIYRSTSGETGTFTLSEEVSADTLTWSESGLDRDTTYFYKIRAYCMVGDEMIKGSFSSVYKKNATGWVYKTINGTKYKLYYNSEGKLVKDVSNILGKQSSYRVKVNKQRQTITVYAKDGDNGYIIPVKSMICSPGPNTPTGTYYTKWKGRWAVLQGPSYGQWCTKFTGQKLFHSVFYDQKDNKTLTVWAFNDLGTTCSHGCIRLKCDDARWIYQNCDVGMRVTIYNSSYAGPFGKPTAPKLPDWHKWDPTDPYAQKYCEEKGCH